MSGKREDLLPLSTTRTAKANTLHQGLAGGDAELLERVAPTTAALLRWWKPWAGAGRATTCCRSARAIPCR